MSYFKASFPGSVGEKTGCYDVIATPAVRPAHAGGASTSLGGFSSDDSVFAYSGLSYLVPKVPVTLVADDRLFLELGANCRVDL